MTNNYIVDNERQTHELLQEEHQRRSQYINTPQYLIQWYGHSHPEIGMIFKRQKECTNFLSDYAFIYDFDIDIASKGSNRIKYISKCRNLSVCVLQKNRLSVCTVKITLYIT